MPANVVEEWNVSERPDASGRHVEIETRAPGLISWVLNLMGIKTSATLEVYGDHVVFKQGKWTGNRRVYVPLDNLTGVTSGKNKPHEVLIAGLVLAVPTFGIGLVICLIIFALKSTFVLGVEAPGISEEIDFSNKSLMGDNIEEEQVTRVGRLIENLCQGNSAGRSVDELLLDDKDRGQGNAPDDPADDLLVDEGQRQGADQRLEATVE